MPGVKWWCLDNGYFCRDKGEWVGSGWFQRYRGQKLPVVWTCCMREKNYKSIMTLRRVRLEQMDGFENHLLRWEDCIWVLLQMINVFRLEQPLSFPDRRTDRDTAGFFILLTASPATPQCCIYHGKPICTLARVPLEICYASVFQDTLL